MTENSMDQNGNHENQEPKVNLASQLNKSENALDLNSMMQLATTLLKNDALMSSVTERIKQKPTSPVTAENKNPDTDSLTKELKGISNTLTVLTHQLEMIASDLSSLKNELVKEKKPS